MRSIILVLLSRSRDWFRRSTATTRRRCDVGAVSRDLRSAESVCEMTSLLDQRVRRTNWRRRGHCTPVFGRWTISATVIRRSVVVVVVVVQATAGRGLIRSDWPRREKHRHWSTDKPALQLVGKIERLLHFVIILSLAGIQFFFQVSSPLSGQIHFKYYSNNLALLEIDVSCIRLSWRKMQKDHKILPNFSAILVHYTVSPKK